MSYCYGFEKECIVNGDSNAKTVQTIIAGCSDQTPLFSFDAGQAFLEAIGAAGTISDVGWPSYLSDDFTALAPTTQAMSVFFILGTSMVGLSVMLCLTTIRYIWQPRGTMSLTTGLESPPNYPGYADSSLSDTPPSKLKLLISVNSGVLR
ncbi:hypothetical protein N7508_006670 [Penicillium antarcticum]|uniref:uncharacterized protein n=1 Tax=Penicillium antarcticum TaxID=416450 RepID=UPI00239A7249|nr:uncharacterized protein N7508_006670 [Penicillium antarcticum]KAJ5301807.1 hypothetical protein N7508_006670 [Penicillium antarcticum]